MGEEPPIVVVVILDGWPYSLVMRWLEAGQIPEIADWARSVGAGVHASISPFMSLSHASHASILTTMTPSMHGIPAHLWIDRASSRLVNLQARPRNAGRNLHPGARTLFQQSGGGTAVHGLVTSGATRVDRPPSKSPNVIIGRLVSCIRSGMAGPYVCWLPSTDAAGHRFGPKSVEFVGEAQRTSRALAQLFEQLEALRRPYRLVLASDHGMRESGSRVDLRELRGLLPRAVPTRFYVNPLLPRSVDLETTAYLLTTGGSVLHVYLPASIAAKATGGVVDRAVANGRFSMAIVQERNSKGAHRGEVVPVVASRNGGEDFPRLHRRISEWFFPDRCADVTLVSRPDAYFGAILRAGYNWGRHRGTHGGPSWEESMGVAIGVAEKPPIEPIPLHQVLPAFGIIAGVYHRRTVEPSCVEEGWPREIVGDE